MKYLIALILTIIIAGAVFFNIEKLIPLYPGSSSLSNRQKLELLEKMNDKEIKKVILNEHQDVLRSKILKEENEEKYKVIRDSLNDFPNKGEYRVQSLRLDSLLVEYSLFVVKISKLKTTKEKEEVLKEYLEVDNLETRYLILAE